MPKKPSPVSPIDNEADEVQPETQIFNNIQYFPGGEHVWKQQGPYVVCQACPLHHAVFIGIEKVMIGVDEDGKPILRDKESI